MSSRLPIIHTEFQGESSFACHVSILAMNKKESFSRFIVRLIYCTI